MDRENEGRMIGGLMVVALLTACGSRKDAPPEMANTVAVPGPPAEAIAEVAAVPPLATEVRVVETAGLLPPGSRIVPGSRVEGAVAFAYRTPDAPAAVARWYRGRDRSGFRLLSEMDEGGELVLNGTTGRPAGEFTVRLAAASGGGTTAMVLVTPRQ